MVSSGIRGSHWAVWSGKPKVACSDGTDSGWVRCSTTTSNDLNWLAICGVANGRSTTCVCHAPRSPRNCASPIPASSSTIDGPIGVPADGVPAPGGAGTTQPAGAAFASGCHTASRGVTTATCAASASARNASSLPTYAAANTPMYVGRLRNRCTVTGCCWPSCPMTSPPWLIGTSSCGSASTGSTCAATPGRAPITPPPRGAGRTRDPPRSQVTTPQRQRGDHAAGLLAVQPVQPEAGAVGGPLHRLRRDAGRRGRGSRQPDEPAEPCPLGLHRVQRQRHVHRQRGYGGDGVGQRLHRDAPRRPGPDPPRDVHGAVALPVRPRLVGTPGARRTDEAWTDRKSTRLNSSHVKISYAVF